jgi:hypothetical protein
LIRSKILLPALMAIAISLPAASALAHGDATGVSMKKGESVDQRITRLHSELKITRDEEKLWDDVARAMRENAANMEKLIMEKRQSREKMTAKDDLKNYQEIAQAHVDGLKNLRSSFDDLYDAMPEDQRKIADRVFMHMKPPHAHKGKS